MSLTKQDGAPVGDRLRENEEKRPEGDIIDDIISYFEENMKFDPPKGRYGIGADMPDTELYIGDKKAAREFVIGKIQEFVNAEFEAKHK